MSILRGLVLLVTLLTPEVALACSCMWAGPFTKVALGTDLVVLADVQSYWVRSGGATPLAPQPLR